MSKRKKLPQSFFARDTRTVARDLLGKRLVRKVNGERIMGTICETEAYRGWADKACHASGGKTKRNAPMFGLPGTIYVYLVYGMHHCLNIVTERDEYPAAVLIRGVENVSGPGRLTKHFSITTDLSGMVLGERSGLWIEEGIDVPKDAIQHKKRVGVDYAGPSKDWRWRHLTC